MRKTINKIPVDFKPDSLMQRCRIKENTDDEAAFRELLDTAREVARPKALYAESFVEHLDSDEVTIDGITFKSIMLRKNLENTGRVFPFIATCGHEMDEAFSPGGDFIKNFWWDELKAAALGCALEHLKQHLRDRFQLGKTSQMSPGSGDADVWPIQQQRQLFELLGHAKEEIGVELTPSCLMSPNKSISGIRFQRETDFRTCQVCRRKDCRNRAAPLDETLRRSIEPGGVNG